LGGVEAAGADSALGAFPDGDSLLLILRPELWTNCEIMCRAPSSAAQSPENNYLREPKRLYMKHLPLLLSLCLGFILSCTQPAEEAEEIKSGPQIDVYKAEKTYDRGVPIMYTFNSTITDTAFINRFIKRKDIHGFYSKESSTLSIDSLVLGLNRIQNKAYLLFNRSNSAQSLYRAKLVNVTPDKFTIEYNDSTKRLSTPFYAVTRCFSLTRDIQALQYNCATIQTPGLANYECKYLPRFPVKVSNSELSISYLNCMITSKEANGGTCTSVIAPIWSFYNPAARFGLQVNDTLVVQTFDRKLIKQENYKWNVEL
jgi:hypothetical protein